MSNHLENDTENTSKPTRRSGFHFWNSSFTALLILGIIALWMASGNVVVGGSDTDKVLPIATQSSTQETGAGKIDSQNGAPETYASPSVKKKLFSVRARLFSSRPRKEVLHIRARSEADISVLIRSETAGRVEAITGKKGRLIKQGAVLCKLDEGARRATLLQAEALVAQTKSDYFAAAKLAKRGVSAKLNVNTKKSAFDSAMASLKSAKIDLDNTAIKAPFTGIIEDRPAKVGDYLPVGTPCAKLVKLNPLLIIGEVSERNINQLHVGQQGRAVLVTGEIVNGLIRFISPSAKIETRTFRIELEVDNATRTMRNGVTADIYIPLEASVGHQISPAFLTLSDEGEIGVRSVGDNKIVKFIPVKILEQGQAGVWVTGLPKKITIITVGQDFVIDGQKVDVMMEKNTPPKRADIKGALRNGRS